MNVPARIAAVFLVGALAGCAPRTIDGGPTIRYLPAPQPGFPALGSAVPAGTTTYGNGSLAELFVRLTHDLEWGRSRPHLVRYEAPVRVAVTGQGAAPYLGDLERVLAALRRHSGIDIARTGGPANLVVRFVPGREFQRRVPQHFCIVAPGLISWDRLRRDPAGAGQRAFETMRRLNGMTIFIPDNAAPYVIRACLAEEITQALGTANDLSGLGPTIFNDDAAHLWPTRLDHLMLRVLYAPEMRSGLGRAETRVRARAILDRLNPEGRGAPPLPRLLAARMSDWTRAIREAFNRLRSVAERRGAARRAVGIAARRAPHSAYHCRAVTIAVRLERRRGRAALPSAREAVDICTRAHGPGDIRVARARLALARALFEAGNPAASVAETDQITAPLAAHGHAERLVALYALRAAALRAISRAVDSARAATLARQWAAHALGRNHTVARRLGAN